DFYKDAPQRKLAQSAPQVETKRPLERWCRIDSTHEAALPIADADGGCDCGGPVRKYRGWARQIATIEIHEGDAITDSDEAFRLMKSRGITNVIVMGVHTNMCVLGRPFSIRQMVYQGMNVALMRDMTDTMYNPAMKPFASHFTGNDLVVEHIEKFWCPTITSADLLGGKPFTFAKDKRPHLVIISAEDEYKTEITLPEFAAKHLGRDFKVSFVFETPSKKYDLPGIDVVNEADVLLISARRRPIPKAQLDVIRKYVAAGKPVVGIRTASHAFHARDKQPEGLDAWIEIDRELIGGNYQGHTSNTSKGIIRPLADVKHPILTGIPAGEFPSGGTLYLNTPLDPKATELMRGRIEGNDKHEPVAWTFDRKDGGRTFYTSLGHLDDFQQPAFQRLLLNGIFWAASLQVPPADKKIGAILPRFPGDEGRADWTVLAVPGTWESQHKKFANVDGFAWYRCEVKVLDAWKGRGGYLYVEKVDNAAECFINGAKIGVSGAMPPKYANGIENMHRYVIPPTAIKPGEVNVVAIRVFDEGGAGGFKGGAPQIIAGNEAISLEGPWQFRVGDDLAWANAKPGFFAEDGLLPFEKVGPAPKVSQFATVIRREAQQEALSPRESMDHFKVP
ncbi:MAG: ThuA domain-containing protein, partial [Candidatus Saccharimonas sp.]|nr:ThuA domain-containing protein [Planctomycetaceae bacterium]